MDIDSLARLIESANVSVFRTLIVHYLKYIGFSSAQYCDGPYDGGKDFWVETDKDKNVSCAIQLSVEADWRKKLAQEVVKVKKNYGTNILYFISSRRIPEKSFQETSVELFKKHNVIINRFDNQAIATEFIKRNKVRELLNIFGIVMGEEHRGVKKYLGPKKEAIASLLIFGEEAKEMRDGIYDSLIKSYLARYVDGLPRTELVKNILKDNKLSIPQEVLVNSHVDRLLQKKSVFKSGNNIVLTKDELDKFNGLLDASEYEAIQLAKCVEEFLKNNNITLSSENVRLIIDNVIELTIILISESFEHLNNDVVKRDVYHQVQSIIISAVGESKSNLLFEELSRVVSQTKFAKQMAGAQLYISLLNTDSSQLIGALGGSESVNVYIDASVAIPLLCGVIFSSSKDRAGNSGKLLFDLINEHEFNAIIPNVYLEEISAHLIEACRDYKEVISLGEDLSYSANAFVSHFSSYNKNKTEGSISFGDYVRIFGVNINEIRTDMPYESFFSVRDRVKSELAILIKKYGIEHINIDEKNSTKEGEKISALIKEHHFQRPDILVKHDACVVKYLSGLEIPAGYAKVLCTWDKIHAALNPDGRSGYFVLTPIAVIDLFSVAKRSDSDYQFSHLIDFAKLQNEQRLQLSSKIWDDLTKIEKGGFSDAELILKAKDFKEDFLLKSGTFENVSSEEVANAWMAWKNR